MISVTRITSVEYYEAQDRTAAAENGRDGQQAGRDEVAYYTDNGQGESQGVWWTRSNNQALPPLLLPSSPFGQNGAPVNGRHLRDLAAGRHPETKGALTKGSANGKRSVGFDLQISAPKSVSVLAAISSPETRARIFDAHDRAIRRALDHAFDSGLVVAHRAVRDPLTGQKSYFEEPVAESSAAVYRHFTSRAKDPQLHSHAVIMNVASRPDGTTGAIDNRRLKLYGGSIAALYRAELASILKSELGVEAERKGRNFEIAGIPADVLTMFSKRRAEIVEAMDGKSTSANRGAAQVASYETREEKDWEVTIAELEIRWNRELAAQGWNGEALWRSAQIEAKRLREGEKGEDRAGRIEALTLAAIGDMTRHHAVVDDRLLMRDTIEALQTECSANEALAAIERLKASGAIQQIGTVDERPVYSTAEIIEAERSMLQTAKARQGERVFVPASAVEKAIQKRETIRADQAVAVRHALNNDGLAIVEGSAGSGKSFSLGAVAEVARDCGLETWTIAPSWKATEVVRSDTETAEEYARAVAGFVHRVEARKIVLTEKSVVIVDEAGMVGTAEMAKLVEATAKAQCKLVLTGDTRQLQPVVAGAPMRAIARLCGSSRMTEITRQKHEWQQAASKDLADGQGVRALEAYDRAGRVRIEDDREATIARLVEDYAANRRVPEFMTHRDGRPVTRAILTSWNVDVREINQRVREAGRAAGWIGEEDWSIRVYPRGSSTPTELAFAKGDDIIFGETVENVGGQTIRNADLGRIVEIAGDRADPILTIRLVKGKTGKTVTLKASALVGHREEREAPIPRMQHAAAMTVHAAQGVTVDHAFVANLRGMGQESSYVAMTRHRESVRYYADASRIVDQIAATDGAAIRQARGGGTTLPEEGDRHAVEVTPQEIKKRIFNEATKADQKENASDHFDLRTFLEESPKPVAETVTRDAAQPVETARPKADREATPPPIPLKPAFKLDLTRKPMSGVGAKVDALRERMAQREQAANRYPVPKPAAEKKDGRITDEEFNHFRRQDLAAFAEAEGMVAVGDWENGKSGQRFRLYQDTSRSDGSKVNIAQWPSGDWSFATRDGSTSGNITHFLAWKRGGTPIQAAHDLRRHFRTAPEDRKPLTEAKPAIRPASAGGSGQGNRMSPEEKAKAQRIFRYNWQRMGQEINEYLVRVRGILPEILQRFRSEIRTEPSDPAKPWFKSGTACFAHRDLAGNLVGYERKGEEFQQGGKRSFSRMVNGSDKLLTMMGETKAPKRIYVAESAVEALSVYQHHGQPQGALLCSPYGNPKAEAVAQLAEFARQHPEAEIHLALNNDEAGRAIAAKFREAIREARGDEARIVDQSPDEAFKDWNDQVRGITAEQAEKAKAERQQKEQEDRERREAEAARIAAEEEARRREAEAAAATPRYVPR